MPVDYGKDLELASAFQRHFPLAVGTANLVRAVFRRLSTSSTDECGKIYSGRCLDVREFFAARLDAGRLPSIARQVEITCLYDERIDTAKARVSFDSAKKKLKIEINLAPSAGPGFTLVLLVDSVTADLLSNGAA